MYRFQCARKWKKYSSQERGLLVWMLHFVGWPCPYFYSNHNFQLSNYFYDIYVCAICHFKWINHIQSNEEPDFCASCAWIMKHSVQKIFSSEFPFEISHSKIHFHLYCMLFSIPDAGNIRQTSLVEQLQEQTHVMLQEYTAAKSQGK